MMRTKITLPLVFAVAALAACSSTPRGEDVASYVQVRDGSLLWYRKVGTGPVVIVPGANWLEADVGKTIQNGRTAIFYDLRGRGRSDASAIARFERDLQDLEDVARWFQLEHFSLVGFDYSAALAANYAAQHPLQVEKLVLVSPIPASRHPYFDIYRRIFDDRRDDEAWRKVEEARRQDLRRSDPEAWAQLYARALLRPWFKDPGAVRRMKSRPWVRPNLDPERGVLQYMSLLRALGEWDWRPALAEVRSPALLIFGDGDPMPREAMQDWQRALPESRIELLSGAGHVPWVERRRSFEKAVGEFLPR